MTMMMGPAMMVMMMMVNDDVADYGANEGCNDEDRGGDAEGETKEKRRTQTSVLYGRLRRWGME